MIFLSGRFTPVFVAVCLLMTGIGGATVGAHSAADGAEPIDMYDRLYEDSITDDGELKEREPPETQPEAIVELNDRTEEFAPDTPTADQWIRDNIVKPMVLGAFWVADAGYRIGFAMASTIGVGATTAILYGAVATMLGGMGLYVYRLFREVPR